jgi:transcriptional regulator with XRE-family HTH domain
MTSNEIKRRLKEKGLSQADLCRRWGASATAISFVVHHRLKSDRLEIPLSKLLSAARTVLKATGFVVLRNSPRLRACHIDSRDRNIG